MDQKVLLIGGRNACNIQNLMPKPFRQRITAHCSEKFHLKSDTITHPDFLSLILSYQTVILFIEPEYYSQGKINTFAKNLFYYILYLQDQGLDLKKLKVILPILKFGKKFWHGQTLGHDKLERQLRKLGSTVYRLHKKVRHLNSSATTRPDRKSCSMYTVRAKKKLAEIIQDSMDPFLTLPRELESAMDTS